MSAPDRPRRRPRRADLICLGGIVLSSIFYLAMIPVLPSLIGTHPVLLELLSGSLPAQLTAGAFARVGRTTLLAALAAPVVGLSAFDPFWWWAGRRYGETLLQHFGGRNRRSAKGLQRGLRMFERFGGWTLVLAYFLPVPNTLLYAMAGWAGFGFLRFVLLDLAGTMLNISVNVGLGYALGARAAHVAGLITRYSLVVTVALIALLILMTWWRNRPGEADMEPGTTGNVGVEMGMEIEEEAEMKVKAKAKVEVEAEVTAGWEPDSPAAAQVAGQLRPLVAGGAAPGLVYAVITPDGTATGQLARADGEPLGPHVTMEIGSVTKVFTALLLADMTVSGAVRLDDPIAGYLPAEVRRACPAAASITLRHLAMHTSGLPRLPRNLLPRALMHPRDPYAGYTTQHLYRALRSARARPPAPYLYSNYGFGLLGHLLSRAAGAPYSELVADRITGPLGLAETGIEVTGLPAATGHRNGRPAPAWHMDALAGAGQLRSTAADMARFLQANLHPEGTPLAAAIGTAQGPWPSPAGVLVPGLAWHVAERTGRQVLWHNGGTGGFSAMLALDREAGCGVAALASAAPSPALLLDAAVLAALDSLTSTTAESASTP